MSDANAISDLERAEHLAYADGKGVKRVSLFNDGVQINAATEEKQDPTAKYQLANYDVSASPIYIGKVDSIGGWMIKQIDTSTGIALYFKGDSDYATNWSGRAGLAYDSFDNIF